MRRPGLSVFRTHQLLPELAADLAGSATIVFVDAEVGSSGTVSLRRVQESTPSRSLSHRCSPGEWLAILRELHHSEPEAWNLGIPAESFAFGARLSPRCMAGVREAIRLLSDALESEG
jgi:Ni,Fe-hydrogenase maturation factor